MKHKNRLKKLEARVRAFENRGKAAGRGSAGVRTEFHKPGSQKK